MGQVREMGGESVKFLLIGNKADLETTRKVSQKAALDLARVNGMLFMETSCVSNYNIERAFQEIAECLYRTQGRDVGGYDDRITGLNGISILSHASQVPQPKKKCCN